MNKYDRKYSCAKKWQRLNEVNSDWRPGYNFGSLTLSGQGAKHVLLDGNKNKSLDKNAVINTID